MKASARRRDGGMVVVTWESDHEVDCDILSPAQAQALAAQLLVASTPGATEKAEELAGVVAEVPELVREVQTIADAGMGLMSRLSRVIGKAKRRR